MEHEVYLRAKLVSLEVKCHILKSTKPSKANITKEQWRALKSLKQKGDVVILPADKWNATMVVNES